MPATTLLKIPLSSHVLSENLSIKIYIIIILLVVLYGREIWILTVKDEHTEDV
jgi:hypothetical protein